MNVLSDLPSQADLIDILLNFANADLEEYRPGDWMNLRDDLRKLIQPQRAPAGSAVVWESGRIDRMSEADIAELQQFLREFLRPVALHESKPLVSIQLEVGLFSVARGSRMFRQLPIVRGGVGDCLLFRAMLLLEGESTEIRSCPECGRLFAVNRGKKFCSRRCSNLAAVKRYHRRNNGGEK